ncbi:MAG: cyclic nucleotide-binding domain-containing protein [Mariprofundaceae bacterium]
MNERDFAQRLCDHEVFGRLTDAGRSRLIEAAQLRRYADGELLIREGEFNDALLLVLGGRVQVRDEEGEIAAELAEGAVLGEISTSGMSLPVADVVARGDVEVLAFPIELVSEVAFEEDDFAEALRELGMRRAEGMGG